MAKRVSNAVPANEKEIWLPVVGWEGLYEVSSLGRVRSLDRAGVYRCFCGHGQITRNLKGRVLRPYTNPLGYKSVNLTEGEKRQTNQVHRLVCRAFHGEPSASLVAAHNDGNPSNNSADNLRWATPQENAEDKWGHGTMLTGGECPWSKVSDELLQTMRSDGVLKNGEWARRLGLSRNHVSKLMTGSLRGDRPTDWQGAWLHRAVRRPYGGLTKQDKLFILAHPEMRVCDLAEKFGVTPKRITNFKYDYKSGKLERIV